MKEILSSDDTLRFYVTFYLGNKPKNNIRNATYPNLNLLLIGFKETSSITLNKFIPAEPPDWRNYN